MIFDDSDIKIFKEETVTESFDEISAIAEMTRNRNNGNSEKAKELGTELAEMFVDEPKLLHDLEGEVGALDFDGDIMYQIKVLLVFTAEYCVNLKLSSPLLSNTAVNAMHETVSEKAFEFYDRLDDAAEYSFYYLAVRNGGNIAENIGAFFSMLCGREKDAGFAVLGKKLFETAKHEVEKTIEKYKFI